MLIDTHTHICDERLIGSSAEIIASLNENNIESIIEIGCDLPTSIQAVGLANNYDNVYAAVGVHPIDNVSVKDEAMDELYELAMTDKVVAIGEIGFDYHYDNDRAVQRYNFDKMLELAARVGKPVILHIRDAYMEIEKSRETLNALNLPLLFHCYSGSLEITKELIKWFGDKAYFAFGGAVTFNNYKKFDVIKEVPIARLLIETDCPYMTPVPHRGETNTPIFVGFVARKLAEILDMTEEEIAEITTENAKRLFKIR